MSLNRVEIQGTLTRDPELKHFDRSGADCLSMTLAVNDAYWDSQTRQHQVGTAFVAVDVWDAQAVAFAERLGTGDEVYVLGRWDQREIERKDGSKDRKSRVHALTVQLVRSRAHKASQTPATAPEEEVPRAPVF